MFEQVSSVGRYALPKQQTSFDQPIKSRFKSHFRASDYRRQRLTPPPMRHFPDSRRTDKRSGASCSQSTAEMVDDHDVCLDTRRAPGKADRVEDGRLLRLEWGHRRHQGNRRRPGSFCATNLQPGMPLK